MFSLKVNRFLLLFIIISAAFFSCSESTAPDSSILELVPLDVGNEWEYEITRYDSTGNINFQNNYTSKIFKDTVINGIRWYCDIPYYIRNWYTNKSDGYWIFFKAGSHGVLQDTSLLLYKYPTYVGEIYGNPNYPFEVVSVDVEVIVPAGKFRTIHFSQVLSSSNSPLVTSHETYICPGIGFIKSEDIWVKMDGTKTVTSKSELVSFELKRYFGNLY
jgi:hypothetical protein